MHGTPSADSQNALQFIHRLLAAASAEQPDLSARLMELTAGANDPQLADWARQLDHIIRQQSLEAAARLVRRLAHDFGNILTGILGFSELALGQPLDAEAPLHAYISEVYRSAQNGAQYTNLLRLFARRQSSGNRSCAVSAVLADEEKRLRTAAGAELQLRFDLPANLPAAAVDAEHLRQVLAALLDNARDAVGGSGTVAVTARPAELSADDARALFGDARSGAHLEILIADSGRGLTAEAQRLLFAEPFFSTKSRKGGFGLATAYGILAAHHGGIELRNRPDGGALARLVIPTIATAAPAEPRPTAIPSTTAAGGHKILVVDDDPMILQFVTTTLQRAGYRVQAVSDAEQAMSSYTAAGGDPFHLVLSDVLMPQLSGIDLAKRLLAHDAAVRVLFMSGQASEFPQDVFAPGQFDLLPKPFRPEGLVRAVRAALERAAPPRPAEAAPR